MAAGAIAAMVLTGPAAADQVRLANGDRLTGKVTGLDGDAVLFDAGPLGTVKIPRASIAGLTTEENVTVEFGRGGYVTGRLSSPSAGALVISGAKQTSARFTVADVKAIHPGDKIPAKQFKWGGRAKVGYTKTSGNTQTEAYNVDGEVLGRGDGIASGCPAYTYVKAAAAPRRPTIHGSRGSTTDSSTRAGSATSRPAPSATTSRI